MMVLVNVHYRMPTRFFHDNFLQLDIITKFTKKSAITITYQYKLLTEQTSVRREVLE